MPSRRPATASFAAIGVSVLAAGAIAEAEIVYREFSGSLAVESRWFPETGAYPGQASDASSLVATPTLYLEDAEGRSLNIAPFFRYDSVDSRRTHADLREAYFLAFGDIGDDQWELRVGVDQVFWGVTESQHLVDIVNQIDLVDHPSAEVKLGQPMVHFTRFGNWGTLEAFALPYHRARSFPGRRGRLRTALVVDGEQIRYENAGEQWHLDLAARYSQSIGLLDLGLSFFDGTSRDPFAVPGMDDSGTLALIQLYEQIRQIGLDAQLTAGAWLFKLEAIQRSGERNLFGVKEDYAAAAIGGEYPFYSVFGSAADVIVVGEWNYDERGDKAIPRRSPVMLQNDLFLGAQLAFNDVQSTEILASLVVDRDTDTRFAYVEFNRRLSDRWSLHLEATEILRIKPEDIYYDTRRDSFAEVSLSYFF